MGGELRAWEKKKTLWRAGCEMCMCVGREETGGGKLTVRRRRLGHNLLS